MMCEIYNGHLVAENSYFYNIMKEKYNFNEIPWNMYATMYIYEATFYIYVCLINRYEFIETPRGSQFWNCLFHRIVA
jgi:hypothetical protein